MFLPWLTDQEVLDQLISGRSFGKVVIKYSFPQDASQIPYQMAEKAGFSPLNAYQQKQMKLAIQTWNDLIQTDIRETSHGDVANIQIAKSTVDVKYAHAYYPPVGNIWLNSTPASLQVPDIGSYSFFTYVHEFGHSLGLRHMGDYTTETKPYSKQDSWAYSVMSYFGQGSSFSAYIKTDHGAWTAVENGNPRYAQTPMINDIMAIQAIYGESTTTRTDDTVYGFNSTVQGELRYIYDFSLNKYPILTLFDSGGIDTLDLSGWSLRSKVNLEPGSFSNGNGMTKNIGIARNTIIENVITGAGNDDVIGNLADNIIHTGAGNDLIFASGGDDLINGGHGEDTVVYGLSSDSFLVSYEGISGSLSVRDLSLTYGRDTLEEVEQLRFTDQTFILGPEGNLASNAVSRFFDEALGRHLFITDHDLARLLVEQGIQFEGAAFFQFSNAQGLGTALHQFKNPYNGAAFFTASAHEATVLLEAGEYIYEGVASYVSDAESPSLDAIHRFYNAEAGYHFYTASEEEVHTIQTVGSPAFVYEGVAFYA